MEITETNACILRVGSGKNRVYVSFWGFLANKMLIEQVKNVLSDAESTLIKG